MMYLQSNQIVCGFTSVNWNGAGFKGNKYAFLLNITNKRKFIVKDVSSAIYTNKDGDLISETVYTSLQLCRKWFR